MKAVPVGTKLCEGTVNVDKPGMGQDMSQSTGGYELVFSGVIFALGGLWLDRKLGTVPLFTIVLTIVGFTGAVLNIYYRYKREIERLEAETAAMRRSGT